MRKASPSATSSPNSWSTAAVQAGNAPRCSGSTTCCATTSPFAFISAQDASWDSRTMVEKPVRNSEFCISCTMPERLAFATSRSMGSMSIVLARLPHDDVLPLVHARDLARTDERGAVELIEDRGPGKRQADVETLARIDATVHFIVLKPHPPAPAPRVPEACARRLEFRQLDRREQADSAHAIRHNLHRLLRRRVAEHGFVLRVECDAQLVQIGRLDRLRSAGDAQLIALSGIAHVERPLDADGIGSKAVGANLRHRLRGERVEEVVHL